MPALLATTRAFSLLMIRRQPPRVAMTAVIRGGRSEAPGLGLALVLFGLALRRRRARPWFNSGHLLKALLNRIEL